MDILNLENMLKEVATIIKKVNKKYAFVKEIDSNFNIFEYISEKYYYENLHSDIIKAILEFKQANLISFLNLINEIKNNSINIEDYEDAEIFREEQNIDILIKGKNNKAIIIENKINNAEDQKRQLIRYIEVIEKDYTIDAVIYLSFDGKKTPDYSSYNDKNEIQKVEKLLILLATFNNTEYSIYHWIEGIKKSSTDKDFTSFIYQYFKLLTHLAENEMEKEIEEKIIEKIVEDNNFLDVYDFIKNIKVNRIRKFLFAKLGNNLKRDIKLKDLEIEFSTDYLAEKSIFDFGISNKNKKNALYFYSFDKDKQYKINEKNNLEFEYVFYGIARRWDGEDKEPSSNEKKQFENILGKPKYPNLTENLPNINEWIWVDNFNEYEVIPWVEIHKDGLNKFLIKIEDVLNKVEKFL